MNGEFYIRRYLKTVLTLFIVLHLTGCGYHKRIDIDNDPHTDNNTKVYAYLKENYIGDFCIKNISKETVYGKAYNSWFLVHDNYKDIDFTVFVKTSEIYRELIGSYNSMLQISYKYNEAGYKKDNYRHVLKCHEYADKFDNCECIYKSDFCSLDDNIIFHIRADGEKDIKNALETYITIAYMGDAELEYKGKTLDLERNVYKYFKDFTEERLISVTEEELFNVINNT